jgi:hypothetical protein
MNKNKNRKYLKNIKAGQNSYEFTNNITNTNPYPLYLLPYSTCANNNDTYSGGSNKCYTNNNIKKAIDFWNSKIAIYFHKPPIIEHKIIGGDINNDEYSNKLLQELTKKIQILINMGNLQSINNPRLDLPSVQIIEDMIKNISFILNKNLLKSMPHEWCKNKNELNVSKKKNKNFDLEWLSNEDIDNILYEYEYKFSNFKFLGTLPIDWQESNSNKCIIHKFLQKDVPWVNNKNTNKFCSLNLNHKQLKDKNLFGLVLNTDKHNKGGQHWFSIYINLNRFKNIANVFIYDSASTSKNTGGIYIDNFIKKLKKDNGFTVNLYRNSVKSQIKSNSECGMFSVNFIKTMLDGDTCNNYYCIDNNTTDSLYIWNKYFNNPNNKTNDFMIATQRFNNTNLINNCNS